MIDARLRRIIDPPLDIAASCACRMSITANQVTIGSFLVGMLAIPLLAQQQYSWALVAIAINRLGDGLDGAVARRSVATDIGGYLDIVLDFIFYSGVVFGFVLARPQDATWGAFLIFSFIGTGSSFLAYSTFAAKRRITTEIRGKKSIYYLGGLTEGFETIVALGAMCLYPDSFRFIALAFGCMCWITTATRLGWAWATLKESRDP
jgi:phosphatidylglycerophosphate synthase